jgi:ubiquinone/menaquinone biosynthesis C-methylase UbiE
MLGDVRGKKVLDAACGWGFRSALLVENGAEVVALDASSEMVQIAKNQLGMPSSSPERPLPLNSLDTGSFHVVAVLLIMHYSEDWEPALSEFIAISVRIVTSFSPPTIPPWTSRSFSGRITVYQLIYSRAALG